MKQKYHQYFKFNKNILVAFVSSITISAVATQLMATQQDYLNTTYTLIVDYAAYFSVFGGLHYLDNRKKYILKSGELDKTSLRKDLIKIASSLGLAEIVYTIIRWILQYYLLTMEYEPYAASIISQGLSTIAYMIVVNFSVKMTRLFKDDNQCLC